MALKAVVNNITVELPPTVECARARVCKRLKHQLDSWIFRFRSVGDYPSLCPSVIYVYCMKNSERVIKHLKQATLHSSSPGNLGYSVGWLVGWLVGWNLTSLFSTNTAISETNLDYCHTKHGTDVFGGIFPQGIKWKGCGRWRFHMKMWWYHINHTR